MKRHTCNFKYAPLCAVLAVIMQCCGEDHPLPSSKAVIEAYVRSGEHPYVIFSSSVVPAISGNISDAVVNWGKVTLSDGDTSILLTGRVDHSFTPPFIYQTFDMTGTPGKTYTVLAEFKDLKAHASARMPIPVKIDSITLRPADNDTLRSATLHFTSPEETPAFFYVSMKKAERGTRMLPCMMGTVKTDRAATLYSIPLMRPRVKADSIKYVAQLAVGEKWTVSLNRVDGPTFDFWKAYDDMVLFSNSPFVTTSQSLPTNITGGYGILSAEGSSTMTITIE